MATHNNNHIILLVMRGQRKSLTCPWLFSMWITEAEYMEVGADAMKNEAKRGSNDDAKQSAARAAAQGALVHKKTF
eukprot:SAG31_NODE_645_length_13244_cov_11.768903_4_plen_76_part_00